ncbi:acyltransferase family protein [Acaryochloris marina]|uniref:acyltransferase family protein n=1 Tax=Acaryochloris marina TaxID=155978 RepID=UPI000319B023|nr:acyltransferase [Acaryochloris marina]BDM81966.1 hypothetical protein AM10699_48300 [Acaryochloris marina MBIC10699]
MTEKLIEQEAPKPRFSLQSLFFGARTSKSWMASLDGLRGIAVLLVVATHSKRLLGLPWEQMFLGHYFQAAGTIYGRTGVYIFFILSSFLLTSHMMRETIELKSAKTWINYALKRFIRIYPLYLFVLVVYLIFPGFKFELKDLISHVLLQEAFNHFWTIVVEFKYYLFFPFVVGIIVLLFKRDFKASTLFLLSAIIVTEGANVAVDFTSRLSVLPHIPIFLLGSLAAVVNAKLTAVFDPENPKQRRWMSILANTSFVLIVFNFPNLVSRPLWDTVFQANYVRLSANHGFYTYQAILICVLLVTHLHTDGWIKKVLENVALRFVGIVSFGVYLWHIAVLGYLESKLNAPGYIQFASVFVVTILLSAITYLLFEKPFMRIKLRPQMIKSS